jgi:hypothetical protein
VDTVLRNYERERERERERESKGMPQQVGKRAKGSAGRVAGASVDIGVGDFIASSKERVKKQVMEIL